MDGVAKHAKDSSRRAQLPLVAGLVIAVTVLVVSSISLIRPQPVSRLIGFSSAPSSTPAVAPDQDEPSWVQLTALVQAIVAKPKPKPAYRYVHKRGTQCQSTVYSTKVTYCASGDTTKPIKTVVLIGDSKTKQWRPALDAIGKRQHWQIVLVTHSSCAWTAQMTMFRASTAQYRSCHTWGVRALSLVRDKIKPDAIITSDRPNTGVPGNITANRSSWKSIGKGMATYWRALRAKGVTVVAVRETPEMVFDVPDCLSRHQDSAACSQPRSRAILKHTPTVVGKEVLGSKVTLIDMNNDICGPKRCGPRKNGAVIYLDSHHLTRTFVRTLVKPLEKKLTAAI